jgi:hypothetical protein
LVNVRLISTPTKSGSLLLIAVKWQSAETVCRRLSERFLALLVPRALTGAAFVAARPGGHRRFLLRNFSRHYDVAKRRRWNLALFNPGGRWPGYRAIGCVIGGALPPVPYLPRFDGGPPSPWMDLLLNGTKSANRSAFRNNRGIAEFFAQTAKWQSGLPFSLLARAKRASAWQSGILNGGRPASESFQKCNEVGLLSISQAEWIDFGCSAWPIDATAIV